MQLAVEFIFFAVLRRLCWCINLYDCHFGLLCLQSSSNDAVAYRFPSNKSRNFSFAEEYPYSMGVLVVVFEVKNGNAVTDEVSLSCPVHLADTQDFYACISRSTWAMLPHWYSVRTFQVLILVMLLALKIRLFETKISSRLWSTSVMDPPSTLSGGRLLLPCLVCIPEWLPLAVFVVWIVLLCEVTSPMPNPPPFSAWLGTGFGRVTTYKNLSKFMALEPGKPGEFVWLLRLLLNVGPSETSTR